MNRRSLILALVFLAVVPCSRAADLLDAIAATVNGHIILLSDWQDALRYEALIAGRQPNQTSPADRKASLDRLIDQELLQEQMHASNFQHASQAEVDQRIQEIRTQFPDATSDSVWQANLARYGFDSRTLKQHVALDLDLLRLVDERLRPKVSIDSRTIESYYNQTLLPELRQSGAKEVSLSEVSPKIKELLTQQKVNELLEAWLVNLRSGSQIQTEPAASYQGEVR
ncbi:MAG TPA: SurA N-terminal domain-containing protein [Terriglobales bacterium]|nr:SurA N-terminal domain-containing protein [Terriglobales bacterium]